MLLFVHDNQLQRMALIDSTKDGMLTFYDDEWHRYLKEATSTFDFTVPKNGADGLQYINEKSYISFRDGTGRDHLFTIVKVEESDTEIKLYTEECNLELLNETAPAYTSDGAHSFEEYFKMQWLIGTGEISGMAIGINEIGDYKRAVSWGGSSTKLERLRSLANHFDAEIEFQTKLNADGTIKAILVNVYRKHSDANQGVGTRREDKTLYYGEELTSVRRTVDKAELYTAISPIGTDGLRIQGEHVEKDSNGHTLYYSTGGTVIYAPLAAQKYPAINSKGDPWILLADWSYETKNPKTLYGQGLAKLKAVSEPSIQYEIKGTQELEIGDTVTIHDKMYDPALIIEARVSEQIISFTDPTKNENTYANIRALESKVSKSLQNRALELAEDAKDKADMAIAKAKAAAERAEEQKEAIEETRGAAEEAKTVATTAKEEASSAGQTARQAESTAQNAKSTANQAQVTAESAQAIATLIKSATDDLQSLIRQTSDGLTVGKSVDGKTYAGSYVLVGSDGTVKIMSKTGEAAASFEKDMVAFGASTAGQKVRFCGGKGELSYRDGQIWLSGKSVMLVPHDPTEPLGGDQYLGYDPQGNLTIQCHSQYHIGNGFFVNEDFARLAESIKTDYVTEQYFGPNRYNWSWRKWASGFCEQWVIATVNSASGWQRVGSTEIWKYGNYRTLQIKLTALEDVHLDTDWDGWVTSDSENPSLDSLGRVYFTLYQPTGSAGLDKKHTVRIYVRGRYK